jgi:ankyrin repeat protein
MNTGFFFIVLRISRRTSHPCRREDNMLNNLLVTAVLLNWVKAARVLIRIGADVNFRYEASGINLPLIAVRSGHTEMLELLCSSGADPTSKCQNGWSALIEVLLRPDVSTEELRIFVETAKVPLDYGKNGYLALEKAVKAGDPELFRRILPGVGANAVTPSESLLGYSVVHWDHKYALMLIEAGADVAQADSEYINALAYAAGKANESPSSRELVLALLKGGVAVKPEQRKKGLGPSFPPISRFIESGDLEVMEAFIEAGTDLSEKVFHQSLVCYAAGHDKPEVIRLLGGKCPVTIAEGRAALTGAIALNRFDTALALVEVGVGTGSWADAVSETSDLTDWSPLMFAVGKGDFRLVDALINSGSDVNYTSPRDGYSPIVLASQRGKLSVFERLIEAGANPNVSTHDGWSALMAAVSAGDYDKAQSLLEEGADANVDYNGWSPLDLAEENDYERIVELLRDYGGFH